MIPPCKPLQLVPSLFLFAFPVMSAGQTLDSALVGGGCFWCTEALMKMLRGVKEVIPGYAGGHIPHPSYEAVCTGTTGHAEVVLVRFDPQILSYRDLIEYFFLTHDPTTPNRQGNDIGPQYRSVIFTSMTSRNKPLMRSKPTLQPKKFLTILSLRP
jgi:methionine-S-sulfoxide reductase